MFHWAGRILRVAMALGAAAVVMAGGSAEGQTVPSSAAPPVFPAIDANGVDLTSGQLMLSAVQTSVGQPGEGGLSEIFTGTFDRDNLTGGINYEATSHILGGVYPAGMTWTVTVGDQAVKFYQTTANGPFVAGPGALGATFAYDGSRYYTYTASDGTAVVFDGALIGVNSYDMVGMLSSVTRPNGEQLTNTYISETSGCTSGCAYVLAAVTSNLGYAVKYEFTLSSNNYWRRTKVTAYNLASDYCAPAATSCSFALNWASMTNSIPAYGAGSMTYATTDSLSGTDSYNHTTTYTFTGNNNLTTIQRPSGVTITIGYDASNRVTSVQSPAGTWTYAYTTPATGQMQVVVTDPLSHTRTVLVDTKWSRVIADTNGLGQTVSYSLDPTNDGRVLQVTYPEGNALAYGYNSRGDVTTITRIPKTGSGTHVTTLAYDPACDTSFNPKTCNQPVSITENGATTDYAYDPNHGGVLSVTAPAGANGVRPQVRYGYSQLYAWYKDGSGSIVQGPSPVYKLTSTSTCMTTTSCVGGADESRSVIARGTPGAANNLQVSAVTTQAGDGSLSSTTSYVYNRFGDVKNVDGPLAVDDTNRSRYDPARRLVGQIDIDPDGQGAGLRAVAKRYTYDGDGKILSVDIGTVASQSDADWTLFNVNVAETVTYAYDAAGRKSSETLTANGSTVALTQYSYDAASRLDCVAVRMNASAFGSAPASSCTQTTGVSVPDRITRYSYDAANRVSVVTTGYGAAGQRDAVTTTYRPNGQVETLVDGKGNKTTYAYDVYDRLSTTSYPSPTSAGVSSPSDYVQNTYDDTTWNITSLRLRDGSNVTFTYDARHNPLTKSNPSSSYAYDNLDRLISTGQGGQTVVTAYDALGRVGSVTGPLGAVGYLYDAAGRRTRLTWPDGFYVTYDMDNTGAVKTIFENEAMALASFTYDDLGRRYTLSRGGATTTYQYDPASRLQSLTNDLPGTAQDEALTFAYNPASQITSRTSNNAAYAFQDNYNLDKDAPVNGLNQHTAYGTASLVYDGRGNMTSDGVNTFAYDLSNRLTGTVSGPTPITSLAYDPLDRLYQLTASSGTVTKFAYDGDDLIGEYDNSGTLLRRYVHGPAVDEPLVVYSGAGTAAKSYYVADQQGSIVAKTDGASTTTLAYDEYGVRQGSNPNERFGYTGQIWIGELGLYHYKARAYSAAFGHFLQADPSGYDDGLNLYAYVHGDPVNGIDPSGLGNCDAGTPSDATCNEIVVTAPNRPNYEYQSRYEVRIPSGGGNGGNKDPQKKQNPLLCAAAKAGKVSLAGLFGLNNDRHPIANAFLGNTWSGVVGLGQELNNAQMGQAARDFALGGAYQGALTSSKFMGVGGAGGYAASKGIVGATTDAVADAVAPDLAGPVGLAKLGFDSTVFAGGFVYCVLNR